MNEKMKLKRRLLKFCLIISSILLFNIHTVKAVENNLQPDTEWLKLYGGNNLDRIYQIKETKDGNYIAVGESSSADGDLQGHNMGSWDAIIMKVDKLGNILWIKNIGGIESPEGFKSVVETPDGGYIAVGKAGSRDGMYEGKNIGRYDGTIVKLDSNGNVEWIKNIGGTKNDYLEKITQTSDGNYVAVGTSNSNDVQLKDKHYGSTSYQDGVVVKFDIQGNVLWEKNIGGSYDDILSSVDKTSDGGCIIAGHSKSLDYDFTGKHNGTAQNYDGVVIKLDASGNTEWIKNVGGKSDDHINSIKFIENQGYIMAGNSLSNDGDLQSKNYGNVDAIICKMSMDGNIEWIKNIGGSSSEDFEEIISTSDGGYAVAGTTSSKDHDFINFPNWRTDGVIIKLSSDASIQWTKNYKGNSEDYINCLDQTKDGGFIAGGYVNSNTDDFAGNKGGSDIILSKLHGDIEEQPPVDPENYKWLKLYGGNNLDRIYQIKETKDGNYIAVGESSSADGDLQGHNMGSWDAIIMKVDKLGNILWIKNIGGIESPEGFKSVVETPDGGYIAVGKAGSRDGMYEGKNIGRYDGTIVKLDSNGNVEWIKNIGGTKNDYLEKITQTSDGNYVAVGTSNSNDVQLKDKHYGSTSYQDGVVVKFDIQGNVLWEKNIGGSYDDILSSVDKTSDGGCIIAGHSKSLDYDFTGKHNGTAQNYDGVVIKLDASGNTEWIKNVGGKSDDHINSIKFIENQGYIMAGNSLSNDGDLQSKNYGNVDAIICKMSMDGNIEWIKNIGGSSSEDFEEIISTSDGGYAVAGTTSSKDHDFINFPNWRTDGVIIKLSSDASIQWTKNYKGNSEDYINCLDQTKDGGFIAGGYVNSNTDDFAGNKGGSDIILSKF